MDPDFVKTPDGKTIIQKGGSYVVPAEGTDPELQHRTAEAPAPRSEEKPAGQPSKPKSRKEAE